MDQLPENSDIVTDEQLISSTAKLAPIFQNHCSRISVEVGSESEGKEKTPKRKRTDSDRTPSGSVLSGKVGSLKHLFQTPPQYSTKMKENKVPKQQQTPRKGQLNSQEPVIAQPFNFTAKTIDNMSMKNLTPLTAHALDAANCTTNGSQSNREMQNKQTDANDHEQKEKNANKHFTRSESEDVNARSQDETGISRRGTFAENITNPEVMDVRMVINMFQELKAELSDARSDIATLVATGNVSTESKGKFRDIERAVERHDADITETNNQCVQMTKRESILIGTLNRVTQRFDEAMQRIEKLETINAKRMLTITGFYAKKDDRKAARQQLYAFFNNDMQIEVYIEDFYFLGSNQPPNIVITLQSSEQKQQVFRNIGKIKSYVNRDGKKLIFQDFLTSQQNEARKRKNAIIKENEARDDALQAEVEFKAGQLYVDRSVCDSGIKAPNPLEAINLPMEELDEIMDLQMNVTPKIHKKGNVFIAAGMPIKSLDQIKKGYMSLRLKHPAARHITAVWNLPTNKVFDGQSYCEDEEYGVGARMLKVLKDNDISHRVVYVIRYCSEKLNAERVETYVQAVKALIDQAPYNPNLQAMQKVATDEKGIVISKLYGKRNKTKTFQKKENVQLKKFSPIQVEHQAKKKTQGRSDREIQKKLYSDIVTDNKHPENQDGEMDTN